MGRLFEEHIIRTSKSLDGAWKFRIDPKNIGENEKWYDGIPDSETVIVPSVWGMQDDLLFYDGTAWYEKDFHTDGGCLRFCFGAVMTEAKVWLDGIYLGSHQSRMDAGRTPDLLCLRPQRQTPALHDRSLPPSCSPPSDHAPGQ